MNSPVCIQALLQADPIVLQRSLQLKKKTWRKQYMVSMGSMYSFRSIINAHVTWVWFLFLELEMAQVKINQENTGLGVLVIEQIYQQLRLAGRKRWELHGLWNVFLLLLLFYLLSFESRLYLLCYSQLKLCHLESQGSLPDLVGHLWQFMMLHIQQIWSTNSSGVPCSCFKLIFFAAVLWPENI